VIEVTSRLVERLRAEVDGEVLADPGTRAMYAADASNYRHVPVAVVRPRTVDAAVAAVGVAAELGVPITSRGAGTSIAGNACGEGLVVYPQNVLAGRREAVAAAIEAVEGFASTRLEWLHPLPEGAVREAYDGWDALGATHGGGAEDVQRAVLAQARQGPAPLMEAALYMFRHPEFCQSEVLLEAGRRNFYTYLRSAMADSVTDVAALVDSVRGRESLYGATGRMALPDEVLAFGTASNAERELLRRVLQEHVDERG